VFPDFQPHQRAKLKVIAFFTLVASAALIAVFVALQFRAFSTGLIAPVYAAQDAQRTLSPISIDYLHQLDEPCHSHQIRLRIVCPPISQTGGYDESAFLREVSAAQLDDVFAGYSATMRKVSPDLLIDNIHFKTPYIPRYAPAFVKMLLE